MAYIGDSGIELTSSEIDLIANLLALATSSATQAIRKTSATAFENVSVQETLDGLSDVIITGGAQGDVIYHNGTNWVNLPAGTSGRFLKTQGTGANPIWAAIAGGGDALTTDSLAQFASTTSLQLKTLISDETGSGSLVFGTAPTFATSITGSYLTASEILITDASKNIISAPVATYPSLTELTYVKGVTSALQTQMDLKAPLISPSFTTPTLGVASATSLATSAASPLLLTNGQLVTIALTSQTIGATTLTIPDFASVVDEFTFKTKAQTMSNKTFVAPALGTPASGVGTNITGIPAANILAGSFGAGAFVISTSLQATTIELGHATDTTISRVSAGLISVEGVTVVDVSTAQTLTNKTLTSPVLTTPSAFTTGGVVTLAENTSIALDPAGSADGKYTGITIAGTAGAALAFGDLCYLAVADSRWELADADAAATAGGVMMGMCVLAAAADGNATTMLLLGQIRADAKFPALTIGAAVYVGETAGAIQVAIPTGADNIIRVVGFALTADEIYFNVSQDHQVTVA